MMHYIEHLSDADTSLVRRLVGCAPAWIYAPRLLVSGEYVMATDLLFDLGPKGDEYILINSLRLETPREYADYYRFSVRKVPAGESAYCPADMVFLQNISAVVVEPRGPIIDVEIRKVSYEGDEEFASYDSEIVLRMANGRSIVVGHAIPVYVGVSLRFVG